MLGISYDGWLTVMAMLDPHPAVKAVSPQASPADMYLGDDFHHNGAFRLSYGFEYVYLLEAAQDKTTRFEFDRYDTYDFYLGLGALSNVNERYFKGKMPSWNDFVAHPNYDAFWKRQAVAPYLTRVTVPDPERRRLVGPGGLLRPAQDLRDPGEEGRPRAERARRGSVEPRRLGRGRGRPARAHRVRQRDRATLPRADRGAVLRLPLEGPVRRAPGRGQHLPDRSNAWRRYDAWPPKTSRHEEPLPARAGGACRSEPSGRATARRRTATSPTPRNPVPYRPRPIEQTYPDTADPGWPVWLVQDQRFVAGRPDVLIFETEPLTEDLTVTGNLTARLFASTTGTDADWIVKLIDVYPEQWPKDPSMGGFQLMVANDVLRGRFRKSFETPSPLEPGKVEEFVDRPARPRPPLPEGPSRHGPGAEHLVPGDRPQPADLRAQHLRGEGRGLPGGHPQGPPLEAIPVAPRAAGGEVSRAAKKYHWSGG